MRDLPDPPSLYRAATGAPPGVSPAWPPLRGERRADLAVVGAGFTGLSTALHASERGRAVVVLDAREPGWGASGRNGGQVNPGLKETPGVAEEHFGPLGARMVALSHAAPDLVFDLVRRHQIRCDARQGGTLRLATSTAAAAALRALHAEYARRNMPVRLLEGADLAGATGTARHTAGLLDVRGGDLDPLAYARGLARAAAGAGAAIHGDSPAVRIEQAGPDWIVHAPEGSVRAPAVLLATNGYTGGLWPGLEHGIVPVFSSVSATEPLGTLARDILPLRASCFETGRITAYFRVDAADRLVFGGRGRQRHMGGPEAFSALHRMAEQLWPALRGVRWTHGWNGQLAMTADHYPHLHRLRPGLFAAMGYNGRGVAMATAMGREVARLLDGEEPDMPVTLLQPIPFHRFWRLGVAAAVLRGRVLDGLGR